MESAFTVSGIEYFNKIPNLFDHKYFVKFHGSCIIRDLLTPDNNKSSGINGQHSLY